MLDLRGLSGDWRRLGVSGSFSPATRPRLTHLQNPDLESFLWAERVAAGCRVISRWDEPRGASRPHGSTSRYWRTAEFSTKADAVQIAGIVNSSIGGKATEPHK